MVTPVDGLLVPPPARGTRPRNRRAQIRTAAARLFYERGYEQVSVADVAHSVNVGPSALYRHFAGKADLLYAAIDEIVDAFGAMVEDLPSRDLDGIARIAARTALTYRPLGVLWQREARNLADSQRSVLRGRLRGAIGTLAETLQQIRPELCREQAAFLASAGVNAMSSISFHRLAPTSEHFEDLLAGLALRVLSYDFPVTAAAPPAERAAPEPESRRDQISRTATVLFARDGFDAVSLDDIGAAVGMAGPSIYHHFPSKQALLWESLGRGYAMLQEALADAVESGTTPEQVLRQVSDSYVDLTVDNSDVITNLIAESRHLGPEYGDFAQRAQLGYIAQWVGLVQKIRPDEDLTVSRIKVQAAQMMANSVVRTSYLRDRPGFREDVSELCWILQQ
ncbi:MAG: transcriptional regulator, TetR family [Marmoricola sp.]|nr:transcriptional regulator, TetR family [Marmoricola sp.]